MLLFIIFFIAGILAFCINPKGPYKNRTRRIIAIILAWLFVIGFMLFLKSPRISNEDTREFEERYKLVQLLNQTEVDSAITTEYIEQVNSQIKASRRYRNNIWIGWLVNDEIGEYKYIKQK